MTGTPSLELQADFWNRWNTEAREQHPIDTASLRRAEFVLERLPQVLTARTDRRPRILDVGCGTGWLSQEMLRFGDVTGIDLADEVIARARQRVPDATFLAGDFLTAEFPAGGFDAIVSLETLAHVIDQDAFMRKVNHLLCPGGVLLLTTQNRFAMMRMNVMKQQPGQLRDWLTRQRLRTLTAPYFDIVEASTLVPATGRGVLRLAGSYKVNRLARMVASEAALVRVKERLGLGQSLVLVARKRVAAPVIARPAHATPRFVLISPCGHGNLGDAAIQDVTIRALRQRFHDAEIVAATLNPADTEQRHGVPAAPLTAFSRPGYGGPDVIEHTPAAAASPAPPPRQWVRSLIGRVARAILPRELPWKLRREATHARLAYRTLTGATALIVSGGGQLDEFWGGPFGHPFTLFKWSLLARLRGIPVLVLSVGFGTISTRSGRRLAALALRLARYRSFRDAGSRALMKDAGFRRNDPVYPDLAYAYDAPAVPAVPRRTKLTVAVSPIAFRDPRNWPDKDAGFFEAYLRRLGEVIRWLADKGHRVVLLTSDGPDRRVARDLLALADPSGQAGVTIVEPASADAFITAVASVDVLIASRMHGVLLSHVAGTPVIALSHDRKVSTLMGTMDQGALCLDIARFDLGQFQAAWAQGTEDLPALREAIRVRVDLFRRQLDDQFRALFGAPEKA